MVLPFLRISPILAILALAGCVSGMNTPINEFTTTETNVVQTLPEGASDDDSTVVGLAFSGGGTRAAAFSYGLLKGLEATPLPNDPGRSMLDSVRFISGVSGGSVTAAYYGLKGKAGYGDFREKFLIRDAEKNMRKSFTRPSNLLRAIGGGVNDKSTFGKWLDQNLFEGARFADLERPGAPVVWINASDLYNRTPFIFTEETFAALCSDLGRLPLSEAVAASSAVPVVFTPIVLEAYGQRCNYHPPGWLETARSNPSAPASLRAFGQALESYRDADKLKYVKLVDGGITDNFGVTGISLARAASQTPYGPLTPREAVRIKRVLYLVADAGRAPDADWGATVNGPGLSDLVTAVTDTAISSSVRDGYDAFRMTMDNWQKDLVDYRCSLKPSEVKRLRGSIDGWNCRDLKFFIGTVNFEDVNPAKRAELNKVATRLALPTRDVDLTVAAGSEALRNDPAYLGALRSMTSPLVTAGTERIVPGAVVQPPPSLPTLSD